MKIKNSLLLFIIVINSCSIQKNVLSCDLVSAKHKVDSQLKKKGFDIARYHCTTTDSAGYYILKYLDTTSARTGGGAEVTIEKSTCKVVRGVLYQ